MSLRGLRPVVRSEGPNAIVDTSPQIGPLRARLCAAVGATTLVPAGNRVVGADAVRVLGPARSDQPFCRFARERLGEVEPLGQVAPHALQPLQLLLALHPFGYAPHGQGVRQPDYPRHERGASALPLNSSTKERSIFRWSIGERLRWESEE